MVLRTDPCLRTHWLLLAAVLACVFPARAQFGCSQPDAEATITSLVGRVDVMRDATPWALNIGDCVKPGQMIVTGPASGAFFQLADGSTFEVYANSHVQFRASQGNWKDLLDVWLGYVRIHIQKLGGQPNNNRVHTPTALISVRGTIFDVKVEDNGDTTEVGVEEGLVDVENFPVRGKVVSLTPGKSIRIYKNEPLANRQIIDKGSVAKSVARGLAQAVYEVLLNRQRTPGGTSVPASTGGSSTGVGDTRGPNPPPPPPPPPPPSQ
jgi:hypothetical protein